MIEQTSILLESFRVMLPGCEELTGHPVVMFLIPKLHMQQQLGPHDRADTKIIAYDGSINHDPWEHVSVSLYDKKRCPSWEEMCLVKDLFWSSDETVMQFHPAKYDYVNIHQFCLHLWKLRGVNPDMPPLSAV